MSSIFNKWLEPYRRSFSSIKYKLLQNLDTIKDPNNPNQNLITDKSEGNILVWILSQLAAIAEVLHYYIDRVGEESFLPTARRRDSLILHGKLVDYHEKSAIPSTVTVTLTRTDSTSSISLDHTQVSLNDSLGNHWSLAKDYIMGIGITRKKVDFIQYNYSNTVDISPNDLFNGGRSFFVSGFNERDMYAEGSMILVINDQTYKCVESFATYGGTNEERNRVFIVEPYSSTQVVVTLGDGQFGYLPKSFTGSIQVIYNTTLGVYGNIEARTIDTTLDVGGFTLQAVNELSSGGGSGYEDISTLQRRIPLSIKTLDVAITKQDFIDLAMTRPGVGQVAADYECGRKLTLYIATTNGTPATDDTLCKDVENYISQHCPMTTWFSVKNVGITNIILDIEVTGRRSYKRDYIQSQIQEALLNEYSAGNAKIGDDVRLSDIYALIDNLPCVDYLRVNKFYLKPWPTILNGVQLTIGTYSLTRADRSMYYIIRVTSSGFNVYSKYNGFNKSYSSGYESLGVVDSINGISFSMTFNNSDQLKSGYGYQVLITPNNVDYEEPGFNIPSFETKDLTLTINEIV